MDVPRPASLQFVLEKLPQRPKKGHEKKALETEVFDLLE
jgi:hypothetical protein